MKYAISTDNQYVSAHFGRCPEFTLVDVINGEITGKAILPNPGHAPGAIPRFLKDQGAECIVAGGMGRKAQQLFDEYGITTILGVSDAIDSVCEKIKAGLLTGGASLCTDGGGKHYGLDKEGCDHDHHGEGHCH